MTPGEDVRLPVVCRVSLTKQISVLSDQGTAPQVPLLGQDSSLSEE
jgi:hypothetical protein